MARRKGDINSTMTTAATNEPHTPGNASRHNGTKKRKAKAIMATLTMEYTNVMRTREIISLRHRLSWFMVRVPVA